MEHDAHGVRMIPPPYPFPDKWAALAQRGGADAQRWLTYATPLAQDVGRTASATARVPPQEAWSYQHPPPAPAPTAHPVRAPMTSPSPYHELHAAYAVGGFDPTPFEEDEEEQDTDDDEEYEYGYVLRDEWLKYLRETVLSDGEDADEEDDLVSSGGVSGSRPRRREPQQQRQGKTQRNATTRRPAPPAVRLTSPLELALEDARALEKERQRARLAMVRDRAAWQRVDSLETALHAEFEAFCDRHAPTVWPQGAS